MWQQPVSSLTEWFFTICPTSYNRKEIMLSASLNKTFPFTRSRTNALRHTVRSIFQISVMILGATFYSVNTSFDRKLSDHHCR